MVSPLAIVNIDHAKGLYSHLPSYLDDLDEIRLSRLDQLWGHWKKTDFQLPWLEFLPMKETVTSSMEKPWFPADFASQTL